MPVAAPIVARPALLVDHTPDAVASANVVVAPTHTVAAPVIAAGTSLTVKVTVASVPQPIV